jgi:hypothetical protein
MSEYLIKVLWESDFGTRQSVFKELETGRILRVDSLMNDQQARKLAAERGWLIFSRSDINQNAKPGLLDRAFNLLRRA